MARNFGGKQLGFKLFADGVNRVENGEIGVIQRGAFAFQRGDLRQNERCFFGIVRELPEGDFRRKAVARSQRGLQAFFDEAVSGEQLGGSVNNALRGAVIFIQHDQPVAAGEIIEKARDIAGMRPAPGEDGLIVVRDGEQVAMPLRKGANDVVLHRIRVLKFVNQNGVETLPLGLGKLRMRLKQVARQQQNLIEINQVVFAEFIVIGGQPFFRRALKRRIEIVLVQAIAADGVHDGLQTAFIRHAAGAGQRDQLGGFVGDGELLGQPGLRMMRPQRVEAIMMKRADQHVIGDVAEFGVQAGAHLFFRLVGERDRDDFMRRDVALPDEIENAGDQCARFARSRPRKD